MVFTLTINIFLELVFGFLPKKGFHFWKPFFMLLLNKLWNKICKKHKNKRQYKWLLIKKVKNISLTISSSHQGKHREGLKLFQYFIVVKQKVITHCWTLSLFSYLSDCNSELTKYLYEKELLIFCDFND